MSAPDVCGSVLFTEAGMFVCGRGEHDDLGHQCEGVTEDAEFLIVWGPRGR